MISDFDNRCHYCHKHLGNGSQKVYTNKVGQWFDRESCRKKQNAENKAQG